MKNKFDIDKKFDELSKLMENDKTIDKNDYKKLNKICFVAGVHKALEYFSEDKNSIVIKNDIIITKESAIKLNNECGDFWNNNL